MSQSGKLSEITALMARRLRCPTCQRRFRSQDISTLDSGPRSGVFQLYCPMCHAGRVILGVWNKNGLRTYATDLDAHEWRYYHRLPPINIDDVLRFYQMLAAYEGDFGDVLEDPILGNQE